MTVEDLYCSMVSGLCKNETRNGNLLFDRSICRTRKKDLGVAASLIDHRLI